MFFGNFETSKRFDDIDLSFIGECRGTAGGVPRGERGTDKKGAKACFAPDHLLITYFVGKIFRL